MKAIAVAELEARNGYNEADHDPFFEAYNEDSLSPDDFALFPDYLVCIPADRNETPAMPQCRSPAFMASSV